MNYCFVKSPIGQLLLVGNDDGLHVIGFPEGKGKIDLDPNWTLNESHFETEARQLAEYFSGERTEFDLRLCPSGTEFQKQVLEALQEIPFGQTRSYRDIADQIGRPKAVRAVGAANGRNPLPIVIPCHRVIGADGSLTGFGGGLPTKTWLLDHEGCLPAQQESLF